MRFHNCHFWCSVAGLVCREKDYKALQRSAHGLCCLVLAHFRAIVAVVRVKRPKIRQQRGICPNL